MRSTVVEVNTRGEMQMIKSRMSGTKPELCDRGDDIFEIFLADASDAWLGARQPWSRVERRWSLVWIFPCHRLFPPLRWLRRFDRGVQNEPLCLVRCPSRMETDEKSANCLALRVIFQRNRVSHSQAQLEAEVFLLANSASFISDISRSIIRKAFWLWDLLCVTRVSMPDRAHWWWGPPHGCQHDQRKAPIFIQYLIHIHKWWYTYIVEVN